MNKKRIFKFIGIIAVVVIGLSTSGCILPEDDGVPKSITITGLSGISGNVDVYCLWNDTGDKVEQGAGYGSSPISNNMATVHLVEVENPAKRWTKADEFNIFLFFDMGTVTTADDRTYFYSGGGNLPLRFRIVKEETVFLLTDFKLKN